MNMPILWDFFCLWAGGRLALSQGNIYNQMAVVDELIRNGYTPKYWPGGFHNPPWSLWLFMPMGALPFPLAASLWTIATLLSFAYCTKYLIQSGTKLGLDKNTFSKFELTIILICFFPFLKNLIWGQSSFIVLLSLMLFLIYFSKDKFFLAGLLLSISCIKLHLFIVFFTFILTASIKKPSLRPIIYGFTLGFLAQASISYALFPGSYQLFFDFIANFAGDRKANPQVTLPHVIQLYTGFNKIHEISLIFSVFMAAYLGFTRELTIPYLLKTILPLSLIFTPYAWSHDHVVLLPAYFLAAQVIKKKYPKDFIPIIAIPFIVTLGFVGRNILRYEHITLWLPIMLLMIKYELTEKMQKYVNFSYCIYIFLNICLTSLY